MELNNLTVKEALLRTKARRASQVCEHGGQRGNRLQLLDTSKNKTKMNRPAEAALHKALWPCSRRRGERQHVNGAQGLCQRPCHPGKCSANASVRPRTLGKPGTLQVGMSSTSQEKSCEVFMYMNSVIGVRWDLEM